VRIVRGPAYLTGDQAAAALSEALGRPLTWKAIAPDRYRELLTPVIGAASAAGIAASYAAPPQDGPPLAAESVITGTTDLARWARSVDWAV